MRNCAAFLWAAVSVSQVRKQLANGRAGDALVKPPPRWALGGERGLVLAFRAMRPTCLESALVRQCWYAKHGEIRDVIIGVTSPQNAFRAHAWLDGEDDTEGAGFTELTRIPVSDDAFPS
jgi:hypothetical protein